MTSHRGRPGLRLVQCAAGLALAFAGLEMGERYISRLPDHRGFYLVPVDDLTPTTAPARPRHAVLIVADGLGLAPARDMHSVARLAAAGQCRETDVGPISVSRPVYAVISTGLEQDRTGARNNDEQSPLAAESIWEVARTSGLEVAGVSDVAWWQQLFPRGFDRYLTLPDEADSFAAAQLADLTLIHVSNVDHMGHQHGGASPEYAAAAARVDDELGRFLDRIDLGRDLIIFTADHGHSPTGGHGGPTPEIARVLTCFAGPGVAHREPGPVIQSRTIAGTLAVLLGLRFPRHMRALEDDLDAIFTIVDDRSAPPAYLADRRAAIERFRAANQASLTGWLGHPGTWSDLYTRGARDQLLRAGLVAFITLAIFAVAARRRRLGLRGALGLAAGCLAVAAATVLLHVLVLGSFDWTAINLRERYLDAAPRICAAPALLAIVLHRYFLADDNRLVADQLTLAALGLAISLAHIYTFAWPLGFPLPGPALLLLPFLAAFFGVIHGLLAALLAAIALVRRR
ncbi:alkaline phosphatase family protein [Nannocystis sp.]|uniref:alkaline phosphatase family protein n=1 Tax=Nannocystis sp. TaxID=1962667 RepID=UPI0025F9A61A|nr:alkaline phosphatase family protein [Nannocystis sp.]MBK7828283.1 alkaline phosphatase family protein [Nannocystis sp.]